MPNGDVVAGQDDYIKDLRPISHGDLTGRRSPEECSYALQSLFWSLLGAVAYTLLNTDLDILLCYCFAKDHA